MRDYQRPRQRFHLGYLDQHEYLAVGKAGDVDSYPSIDRPTFKDLKHTGHIKSQGYRIIPMEQGYTLSPTTYPITMSSVFTDFTSRSEPLE
jgi:hypothetical protein